MKFTLILSLIISTQSYAKNDTQSVWAQVIEVENQIPVEANPKITVKIDNNETVSCELDNISKVYICDDNKKNPILVRRSEAGYFALGKNSQGKIKNLAVTNVEASGRVLYANPYSSEFLKTEGTTDLSKTYLEQINPINEFFKFYKKIKGKLKAFKVNGSERFEEIAQSFNEEKSEALADLKKAFESSNYTIELEDGQKVNCERGESNPLAEEQKETQEFSGNKIQCGSFKCDPVIVNGRSYDASLIYESTPGSFTTGSIFLTDNGNAGPQISIKKITSPISPTPLVDNSYLLENGNSTYYGNYMKSLIPISIADQEEREKIASFKDPTLTMLLSYHKNLCKENEALKKIFTAKEKVVARLAELELAEFIQVLANGSLVGSFVDPSLAPSLGCLYQGVYLNAEAEKNLVRLKKNINPDRHVDQTISLAHATELFNKAANMEDIAWKYKPDGCYARAHLMARRFEAEGVRVDKVWIKGDLYVPGTPINWNFHVAPIVYVEDEKGQIQKMVIDPSLFNKPVTVSEWDQRMSKKTLRGSVVTAFPFPENSAFMERSTLSFSSSDPYLPRDNINMTEEQKMNQANITMKSYKSMEPNQ